MPGQTPKPPDQRHRKRPPAGGEWVQLPAEKYAGPKPKCPKNLTDEAKRTWRWWWSSPMPHQWSRADHAGLVRLIRLIDLIERGEATASLTAEARLGEDRYGLSPKGRQQLRWALPGEPVPVKAEDLAERAERERARKARVMEMLRNEAT